MCPTLTRLVRSNWHGSGRGRELEEEEGEDTRGRKEEEQGKELREVRRREVQPWGVRVNLCHQSQNLWQRRGRRIKESKSKFCYFPEEQKDCDGEPWWWGGWESNLCCICPQANQVLTLTKQHFRGDYSISVVYALRQTR